MGAPRGASGDPSGTLVLGNEMGGGKGGPRWTLVCKRKRTVGIGAWWRAWPGIFPSSWKGKLRQGDGLEFQDSLRFKRSSKSAHTTQ